MNKLNNIKNKLYLLLIFSVIIRIIAAYYIEFGNDEVYYWLYAKFPDYSHFDHPPMVGLFIQLFSLNLTFHNELAIRFSSIIIGCLNTIIIFKIGERIKDRLCGFYAALLYNCSIYCFIIVGVFILPDTPFLFFWLTSIYLLFPVLTNERIDKSVKIKMLIAGITIGLCIVSKYHGIFLWLITLAYIISFNRKWLKIKELYFSIFISFILFIPVFYWNFKNNFISFAFQGERINLIKGGINIKSFFTELFGQILYNNPINVAIFVLVLIKLKQKSFLIEKAKKRFLIFFSIPMICFFLFFSLFRNTLPHWSAPGYITLIILAGLYFSDISRNKTPIVLKSAAGLLIIFLSLSFSQIKFGLLNLGKNDPTLDMYGWHQLKSGFEHIYKKNLSEKIIDSNVCLVSSRWFPASHIDYYVATPLKIDLFAIGSIDKIHKYAWVNQQRGNIKCDAYCIVQESNGINLTVQYKDYFSSINLIDSIPINRNNKIVKQYFVYIMHNYNGRLFKIIE